MTLKKGDLVIERHGYEKTLGVIIKTEGARVTVYWQGIKLVQIANNIWLEKVNNDIQEG